MIIHLAKAECATFSSPAISSSIAFLSWACSSFRTRSAGAAAFAVVSSSAATAATRNSCSDSSSASLSILDTAANRSSAAARKLADTFGCHFGVQDMQQAAVTCTMSARCSSAGIESDSIQPQTLCQSKHTLTYLALQVAEEVLRQLRPAPRHLKVHLLALGVQHIFYQLCVARRLDARLQRRNATIGACRWEHSIKICIMATTFGFRASGPPVRGQLIAGLQTLNGQNPTSRFSVSSFRASSRALSICSFSSSFSAACW